MLTFKRQTNQYYTAYVATSESGNEYRIIKNDNNGLWDIQKLDGLRWKNYRNYTEYETLTEAKETVKNSFNDPIDRKLGYFN